MSASRKISNVHVDWISDQQTRELRYINISVELHLEYLAPDILILFLLGNPKLATVRRHLLPPIFPSIPAFIFEDLVASVSFWIQFPRYLVELCREVSKAIWLIDLIESSVVTEEGETAEKQDYTVGDGPMEQAWTRRSNLGSGREDETRLASSI
ncbi:GYF domain-containing protein [Dorcoceras hygrometricum]|uniref:GYF domain-containing protein n=1 Tax=Dorcoceras hygrometricum TaxID=472368 RepID=A0A2Z7AD19_9LAMI|nr:GYF domain-containing protein [Dorcoceras hygrometricum]